MSEFNTGYGPESGDMPKQAIEKGLSYAADALRWHTVNTLGGPDNISPNKTWAVFNVPSHLEKDRHDTADHAQLLVAHIGPAMSENDPDAKPAIRIAQLAITEEMGDTPRHAIVEDIFLSGDNRAVRKIGGTLLDAEGFALPGQYGYPLLFNAGTGTGQLYTTAPLAVPPSRDIATARIRGRLWSRERSVSLSSPDKYGVLSEAVPAGTNLLRTIARETPRTHGTQVVEPHWY